jgi:hypothetical protein
VQELRDLGRLPAPRLPLNNQHLTGEAFGGQLLFFNKIKMLESVFRIGTRIDFEPKTGEKEKRGLN